MAETPLLCAQTLGSRARVLVCARCACSVGSLPTHLSLTSLSSPSTRPHLPSRPRDERSPCWCAGGCDEAWCSEWCRAAEAYAHSLLCPGPPGQRDDPVAAFTSYCERAGETLLLAARVVAGAVSAVVQGCREEEGGRDEVREEGAEARLVQLRARAETEASRLAGRCLPSHAVASQRREEEGTKVEGREQVEKGGEGLCGEREEEAGEEAEEQMVEACELLRGALSTRMDKSLLMTLSPLLSSQLFVSLVRTLERRLLPLNTDSPLAYECRRIAHGVRDEQAACRPLTHLTSCLSLTITTCFYIPLNPNFVPIRMSHLHFLQLQISHPSPPTFANRSPHLASRQIPFFLPHRIPDLAPLQLPHYLALVDPSLSPRASADAKNLRSQLLTRKRAGSPRPQGPALRSRSRPPIASTRAGSGTRIEGCRNPSQPF